MGYAFISYSTKNQKDADTLREILTKNRIQTWMAPYDIPAGSKYAAQITRAIRDCACFVLLLTNDSQNSAAVDREVELGGLTFKKPLVVIQSEPLELNDCFFFYLHNQQIVVVSGISEDTPEMKKILDAIIEKAGQKPGRGVATTASDFFTILDQLSETETAKPNPAPAAATEVPADPDKCFLMGQEAYFQRRYAEAARFYRNAAEKGHTDSMLRLAELYKNGHGVEANDEEMSNWYLRAAQKGHPEAQFQLASHYQDTERCSDALYWFHRAAEQEHSMAYAFLGSYYLEGNTVDRNLETALMWFKKSIDSGDDLANMSRGFFTSTLRKLTSTGNIAYNKKDFAEAVRCYRVGVQYGHADAQHGLANCYFYGQGVHKDIAEAVRLDMLAADQGHAAAQSAMGYYYNSGAGVAKNPAKAFEWYQKAAQQEQVSAQYNLGKLYYDGSTVPRNYEEAVKWFRKAAEKNYILAQYALGVCYEHGFGVAKDLNEALRWYDKAADQGNANAKNRALLCREAIKKASRPGWFPF